MKPEAAATLFGTLCIRADGGARMGVGHLMRCLALAQAWQDRGGRVVLLSQALPPALKSRYEQEGVAVRCLAEDVATLEEAAETSAAVRQEGAAWLVLDGYHFSPAYRLQIQDAGLHLLVVDDLADSDLSQASLILNLNAYASPGLYTGLSGKARLLLGSRHALLRREFLPWAAQAAGRATPAQAVEVLITLGGGDPDNVTRKVVDLLASWQGARLRLTVVSGPANPHLDSLRAASAGVHELEVLVNPPDLPARMSRADVAITAAGGSCWELACLGVPMLLIITADNQRLVARRLEELGVGVPLGWHADFPAPGSLEKITALLEDAAARERMSALARAVVDGQGAGRVAESIATHPLQLRPAVAEDARLLWEWVNDPAVRQSAFSTAPIPWEGHHAWYARRLADPDCHLWLALDDTGQPVGQVRFEVEKGIATVDVSVCPRQRGRGYAPKLLRLGVAALAERCLGVVVRAWIKPENMASRQSFVRAGFHATGEEIVHGHAAVGYLWQVPASAQP